MSQEKSSFSAYKEVKQIWVFVCMWTAVQFLFSFSMYYEKKDLTVFLGLLRMLTALVINDYYLPFSACTENKPIKMLNSGFNTFFLLHPFFPPLTTDSETFYPLWAEGNSFHTDLRAPVVISRVGCIYHLPSVFRVNRLLFCPVKSVYVETSHTSLSYKNYSVTKKQTNVWTSKKPSICYLNKIKKLCPDVE